MNEREIEILKEAIKNYSVLYFNSNHNVLRIESDRIIFDFDAHHSLMNSEHYDESIMRYYMLLSDVKLKHFYVTKSLF